MVTPRTVDLGPLFEPDGSTLLASATITFTLVDERGKNTAGYEASSGAQVAGTISAVTDVNGVASISLVPNDQLLGATYYNVSPADAYGYTRFRAYLTTEAGSISFADLYLTSQDVEPSSVDAFTLHSQSYALHLTSDEDAALAAANNPNAGNPIATIADTGGGGGGGNGEAIEKTINQTGHGFAVGEVIYFNGTVYAKAKADAEGTLGLFMVSTVTDANNFKLCLAGFVNGLSGLTAGAYYFVSDSTAGALTDTAPSTFLNPIFMATSTTSGFVIPYRPNAA